MVVSRAFRPSRFVAAGLLGLLLTTASAPCDPRWWWDDAQVTGDMAEKRSVDVALATGEGGAGQGGGLFVTWQQRDPVGGDWEIYLTASFDGGCSFCTPVALTDNAVDDTNPRVAVGVLPIANTPFSIQVVFESEGNVILAHEESSVLAFAPRGVLCSQLANAAARVRTLGLYRRLNSVVGTARRPDIDLSSLFFNFNHFHVAWEDGQAGAWDIWTERDVLGDSSGYGGPGFPLNLTAGAIPLGDATRPAVSGDPMGVTASDGAASIAFMDDTRGDVLYLRSSDSGLQWSATGAPPLVPPVDPPTTISSPPARPQGGPSIDAGELPSSAANPLWEMVGWTRSSDGAVEGDLHHFTAPGTEAVTWTAMGDHACGIAIAPDGRSVTAVQGGWTGRDAAWEFWRDIAGTGSEIVSRAARLEAAAATPVDFATFPYSPARPGDIAGSAVRSLTACVFNETTFGCDPIRSAGMADAPAVAADQSGVHLVWIDTRDGSTNIFYKRTDDQANAPAVTATADCESLTQARIHVAIDPVTGCDSSFPWPERIRRYFVYYGTDPGGPYLNAASPIIVMPGGPPPLRVDIGGLALGTTYHVVAIPEDEARNLAPSDFDPSIDNLNAWSEQQVITPPGCAPSVSVSCALSGESCPDPAHVLESDADFGETFLVTLNFSNSGTLAATNFSAAFTIGNATINAPAGGAISMASIPPGGSASVVVSVTIDPQGPAFPCGGAIDMGVSALQSDAGTYSWPDANLAPCDRLAGGADGLCTTCGATPNVIVTACDLASDACPGGSSAGNGVPDPGERLILTLTFLNAGSIAATDLVGDIALSWGGVPGLGFGTLGPLTLAPGASTTQSLVLDVADVCGDLIDIDITNLSSNSGAYVFPPAASACDRRIGDSTRSGFVDHFSNSWIDVPDDTTEVRLPAPITLSEARQVDSAYLMASGTMPAPATVMLRLEGPGGAPGIDVSAAWNLPAPGLDITSFCNGPQGGPGDYAVFARDMSAGGGDGSLWSAQIRVEDTAADCATCAPCSPIAFPGSTLAINLAECEVQVRWPAATGTGIVRYDLYRDGLSHQPGLLTTTYLDVVTWGSTHSYQVEAMDDCPVSVPIRNGASAPITTTDSLPPSFIGSPTASYSGVTNGDCTVTVNASATSSCAPISLHEILRDGTLILSSSSNPFPFAAPAGGNGNRIFSVRLTDAAGNVTTAAAAMVVVDNCDPPAPCLHRRDVADLRAFGAAKPVGYFLVPPGPGDNHVDDPSPTCPFNSGDRVMGVVGSGPLTLWDLNRGVTDLKVARGSGAGSADVVITYTP